jgi:hypothetical protein
MKNLAINVITDDGTLKGVIDLYGDTKIELEYVLSDIREPESRKISYTKEFTVPGTKNNNTLFAPFFDNGYSYTNFNPNKRLNAQLFNGAIFFEGALQLSKVTVNDDEIEYTVIIYNQIVDFFNDIGDAELRGTISLNEYNHILDNDTIKKSWDGTIKKYAKSYDALGKGEGYVYPLEDRGKGTMWNGYPKFQAKDMKPAIFLKTYVDKVFAKYGWTYKSDFFNSDYFKSLVIPFNSDSWVGADSNSTYGDLQFIGNANAEFQAGTSQNAQIFRINAFTSPNTTKNLGEKVTSWLDINWGTDIKDPGNVYNGGIYTCNKAGFYQVQAVAKYTGTITSFTATDYSIRFKDGKQPYVQIQLYNPADNTVYAESTGSFSFSGAQKLTGFTDSTCKASVTAKLNLAVGQRIKVRARVIIPEGQKSGVWGYQFSNMVWGGLANLPEDSGHITIGKVSGNVGEDSFSATLTTKDVQYGDIVPMNNAIPDGLSIRDLFTSLNNMFNLYWEPTNVYKQLRIEPYEDFFYFNKGNVIPADDWTNKIHNKEDLTINPLYELTANEYLFTYKEDNDWQNERYTINHQEIFGQKKIEIDNDFLVDTKTISPIFSPTPLSEYAYYKDTSNVVTTPKFVLPSYTKRDGSNKITSMNPKLRILFWKKFPANTTSPWLISYETGSKFTTAEKQIDKNKEDYYQNELVEVFPYAGHLDNPFNPTEDLSYGVPKELSWKWNKITNNNLFNKYWRNWLNSIIDIDSHMLACKVHLTQLDINAFDLKNFYQVNHVYYRVNKMTYNVDTEMADVELLRVFDYPKFEQSIALYVNSGMNMVTTQTNFVPDPIKPKASSVTLPRYPWGPTRPTRVPNDSETGGWTTESFNGGQPWRGEQIAQWVTPSYTPNVNIYTGQQWILPNPVRTAYAVSSEDYIPVVSDKIRYTNNNIIPESPAVFANGFNNAINEAIAGPVMVSGDNNQIGGQVARVTVLGSNNRVAAGVENTQVVGDNQIVTQSNASYVNGMIIKEGKSMPRVDLIRGGIDTIQSGLGAVENLYDKAKVVTNIRGGKDSVRNFGTQSPEEKINGSFDI